MPEIGEKVSPLKATAWGKLLMVGVRIINWLVQDVATPYLSYAAKVTQCLPTATAHMRPFAPPPENSMMSPILLMAALEAKSRDLETDATKSQSELNAIYHAVLGCDKLRDGSLQMFASLITSGCPQDIAFAQLISNNIELGMYTQRQLQSANAEESQPTNER